MKIPLCAKCSGDMRPVVTITGEGVTRNFKCQECGHLASREGQPSSIKDCLLYLRVEAMKQTKLLEQLAEVIAPASSRNSPISGLPQPSCLAFLLQLFAQERHRCVCKRPVRVRKRRQRTPAESGNNLPL